MRQILLQIPTDLAIPLGGIQIPVFGAGLLLAVWLALCAWWSWKHFHSQQGFRSEQELLQYLADHGVGCEVPKRGFDADLQGQLLIEALTAIVIWTLPRLLPVIYIYGYGMAMVCGFLAGAWLASIRAEREGINPAVIWEVGQLVLFSGVIGARLFFVAEHPQNFFGGGRSIGQVIFELANLPSGGLVLYGGVILGIGAYIAYCWQRKLSALKLADILIPSIFIGEMFGRIGCFLNGCCYGAPTGLPWAVYFPPGSVPFVAEVELGQIAKTAACSLPLHPAQIYSSLNAMVLAILTWTYFKYRSRDGEVLLLGWFLYPITRFCLEMVRNDTPEYVLAGIPLTIAQWVSIGMLIGAAGLGWFLSTRPRLDQQERPINQAPPPIPGAKLQH